MLNKKERMEKLNEMGVNTGKYFNIDLPNGLKPGAKIALIINENGEPVVVADNYDENTVMNPDCVAKQIIEDGYVRNTKLHRRFVMAQMFQMLDYQAWNGNESGYHACLRNCYGYDYTFKMMLDEVKVLSKLESRDKETFEERSNFFTKQVIINVMLDYMEKLKDYVESLPDKKCKGIPYKRVKGQNIFNEDLNKKLYRPLSYQIIYMNGAKNYTQIYNILSKFMSEMVKLPYKTAKSKDWIDAFKGEGAYYTLKNLVMFHDCAIYTGKYGAFDYNKGYKLVGMDAVKHLNEKLVEYQGEGYRMFALMKKVIYDNGFNFDKRMEEIYSK